MKKIFLFAAAAVTMAAGCQKLQEILVNPNDKPVDDNSPVLVTLGTNVSATATTKAAVSSVTDLHGQTINVFGLKKGATDLTKDANYLLGTTTVTYPVTLQKDGEELNYDPYTTDKYYGTANDDIYNFYGYYVGGATVGNRSNSGAAITVPVTIDGQNDILLAETDKNADVIASGQTVDRTRVYSAYSARRGVEPTLVFEHQLSQLTFKLVNGTTLKDDATLKVTDLTVASESKANLVITNDGGCEFVQTPAAEGASVVPFGLPKPLVGGVAANELATFTEDVSDAALSGSIMVMPGQTSYPMVLSLTQNSGVSGATDHSAPVNLNVALASGDTFKAGYSYEVTVKVYASEAVLVKVAVVDWKTGESITIDQDQDQDQDVNRNDANLYAVPVEASDATTLAFEVNVPETMIGYTIEAALSESLSDVPTEGWQALVNSKATTKFAVFSKYLAGKIYYCHLRYKATEEAEYTNVAPTEETDYCVAPTFKFVKAWYINDETSYNQLPDFYKDRDGYRWNECKDNINAVNGPDRYHLPWLAATCTPTDADVVNVKKDGKVIRTFEGADWRPLNGLTIVTPYELGLETIPAGTYTFVINGVESDAITVGE